MENKEKVDVLEPLVTRFRRPLWIPEDAVTKLIAAMNNMVDDGTEFDKLPEVFLFPISLDPDSSAQTAEVKFKNLVAINDYGMLLAPQIEEVFGFTKLCPNWKNTFARLGNLTKLSVGKDYPIFVPFDPLLASAFADMARKEIFMKRCSADAEKSIMLYKYDEYTKAVEDLKMAQDMEKLKVEVPAQSVAAPSDEKKKKSVSLADVARIIESDS